MNKTQSSHDTNLIQLIRCALHGEKSNIEIDEALFCEARRLMVAAMVVPAAKNYDSFRIAYIQSVVKIEQYKYEWEAIKKAFLQENIWFVLLKGAYMQQYYPSIGMREMGDVDILYDSSRVNDVKRIMTKLGFSVESVLLGNEDTYRKNNLVFEMHRSLFGKNYSTQQEYYRNIEQRLTGSIEKHLSVEDMYVYFVAHAHKHSDCSIDLRNVADCYLIRTKEKLNDEYVEQECKKLGIYEFEKHLRDLAFSSLGEECKNSAEDLSWQYRAYTAKEESVSDTVLREGRLHYFIRRVFPGKEWCKERYPFVYKYPAMLPAFWVYRIVRGVILKSGQIKREFKGLLVKSRK